MNDALDLRTKAVQEMRIVDRRGETSSLTGELVSPVKELLGIQNQPYPANNPRELRQSVLEVSNDALEMLDQELDYLDSQQDFEYELEMTPRGLLLTMRKLAPAQSSEDRVRFQS